MTDRMSSQFAEHLRVVAAAQSQLDLIRRIAERVTRCFRDGGRLYLCGNGGSAADAQHIAAELVGRFKHDRDPLPAVALTTDSSILTAVSNDMSFEQCFERQVLALLTDRDILWALSVSGRSPNILRAVRAAKSIRATVIGFTGRQGAMLADLCDLCFRVDHDDSDRVQEAHQLAYHVICDHVEQHSVSHRSPA